MLTHPAAADRGCLELPGLAGTIPVLVLEGLWPGLTAGLTTSERNFRRLPAGVETTGIDPAVTAAYVELSAFARRFGGWARARQVHGGHVERLEPGPSVTEPEVSLGEADGLVVEVGARGGSRLLTITVADCVPVFLAWPGGYGLLHAGWRGVAASILESGLAASGADPAQVRVHLGPAIGGCCYEVGPEVPATVYAGLGDLKGALEGGAAWPAAPGRWRLDLRSALAARAVAAGVAPHNVSVSSHCTACEPGFHSLRGSREPEVRRTMLAFLGAPVPAVG